jgi:hypothetical protein
MDNASDAGPDSALLYWPKTRQNELALEIGTNVFRQSLYRNSPTMKLMKNNETTMQCKKSTSQ